MKSVLVLMTIVATVVQGCGRVSGGSDVDVIGGKNIDASAFPATVMLGDYGEGCTGTFISGNTIVTAAHCVPQYVNFNGIKPKATIVHALSSGVGTYGAYDLALVVFASNVAPATARIASQSASQGDRVTLVGYGCNNADRENGGTKRVGQNTISSVSNASGTEGLLVISKTGAEAGQDALLCSGDSGGPMLNAAGEIVGIASASDFEEKSYHVNIVNSIARAFFAQALGAGVGAIIPGFTPSQARDAIKVDGAQQSILPALESSVKGLLAKNDAALRSRLTTLKALSSQNVLPVMRVEVSGDFDTSNAARLPEEGAELIRGLMNPYSMSFFYPSTETVLDSMLGAKAGDLRATYEGRALAEVYLKEAGLNAIILPKAMISADGTVSATILLLGSDGSELLLQ